jgi:hypothetical protein
VFKRVERRTLSDQDVEDIVAFLNSLSSDTLTAQIAKDKHAKR